MLVQAGESPGGGGRQIEPLPCKSTWKLFCVHFDRNSLEIPFLGLLRFEARI